MSEPGECPECGTRRADVLPSRGDCQTCLRARMGALMAPNKPLAERLRFLAEYERNKTVADTMREAADELERRPEPHSCADPECMDC